MGQGPDRELEGELLPKQEQPAATPGSVVFAVSLLLACLAGLAYASRIEVPALVVDPLGPRRYPQLLFLLMTVLCAAFLISEIRRYRATRGHSDARIDASAEQPASWWRPATAVAALLAYALLVNDVGYLIGTSALLFAIQMVFGGLARWRMLIVVAVATPTVLYIAFAHGLQVTLPAGHIFDGL